jgi:hypothetical protein
MPWHLDNRFIAASGIINVIDNTVSTCFSKIEDTWQGPNNYSTSNIFHRGRTKQFEGTAWLNTEHTWHLLPEVTDVRKVILFNVTFF